MAAYELYNPIYEQIRKLGLSYEIKESGTSVIIKISADSKYNFNPQDKNFRFQTSKTFNGSSNRNWRSPRTFEETSAHSKLPSMEFFRSTPPPISPRKRPPATARPPVPRPPVSTPAPPPVKSANDIKTETIASTSYPSVRTYQDPPSKILNRMPNPYRFTKRVVAFPVTPNLILKPFPAELDSNSTTLATQNLDLSGPNQSPETRIEFPDDDRSSLGNTEALENCMKAIYDGVF